MSAGRWKPAVALVLGSLLLVAIVVLVLRPDEPPPPPPAASASTVPTPPPPPLPEVDATAATAPAPRPSASQDNLVWNDDAGVYMLRLENGELMPLPPGVTSASIMPQLPAEKPQTPEWKLEKTQRVFSLVGDRAKRLEKDADELEKAGKKQEAAEKRVLATRLRKQLESMKAEMAGYQQQILADGGSVDGALYFDAGAK